MTPASLGLPVAEYAANLIKKSVVGTGHAEKAQIQLMVKTLLPQATSRAPTPPMRWRSPSATPITAPIRRLEASA